MSSKVDLIAPPVLVEQPANRRAAHASFRDKLIFAGGESPLCKGRVSITRDGMSDADREYDVGRLLVRLRLPEVHHGAIQSLRPIPGARS